MRGGEWSREKNMGLEGPEHWIFKCSHQNYWQEKEEGTEHIYKSEFSTAELSANECRTLQLPLIYIFIYFADVTSFPS